MSYLGNNNLPWDISRSSPIPTDAERFSGNSSTTTFTLTRSVNFPTDLEVFVENIQQEPTTAYTVNNTSLVFTEAPPTGTNNVYVVYRNYQSGAQVSLPDGSITYSKLANNIRVFTTDNFTANGNVSSYGLSEPPADANTVFVTVDGVVQRAPTHYTTSGTTITFTSTPPLNANVHIRHLGFRTTSTVTALPANSNISQPILQGTTTANGNFLVTNGSVGIGNTSPTDGKLVITGNSVTTAQGIRLTGDTADARFICESATLGAGILGTFSAHSQLFYTNSTERMRIDASGNVFVGGTAQNTATKPVYSSTTAKAWISCSIASSTVTIGASFNVSSVTRNGGGDYTINFSSALADTSYAIAGIASGPGGANAQVAGYNGSGVAVGSYRFYVLNMSNITPTEPNNFYLIFFR
jgi:hypothetical protein